MSDELLALDLGTTTGYAYGPPSAVPISGSWKFSGAHARRFFDLRQKLIPILTREHMKFVAVEDSLTLGGHIRNRNSAKSVALTYGFHAIASEAAEYCGLPKKGERADTIRLHFTGKAKWGSGDDAKRAVLRRCIDLGYVPKDCVDTDQTARASV